MYVLPGQFQSTHANHGQRAEVNGDAGPGRGLRAWRMDIEIGVHVGPVQALLGQKPSGSVNNREI